MKEEEKFLRMLAEGLDDLLEKSIGKRMGFVLMVFPFEKEDRPVNGPHLANYVSNSNREDIIPFLRETADRFEREEVIPPTIGEA